jgi:hypothetical protein
MAGGDFLERLLDCLHHLIARDRFDAVPSEGVEGHLSVVLDLVHGPFQPQQRPTICLSGSRSLFQKLTVPAQVRDRVLERVSHAGRILTAATQTPEALHFPLQVLNLLGPYAAPESNLVSLKPEAGGG